MSVVAVVAFVVTWEVSVWIDDELDVNLTFQSGAPGYGEAMLESPLAGVVLAAALEETWEPN